jgi:1-acyl-sn-glycerol-3-phosphate acyltransferase
MKKNNSFYLFCRCMLFLLLSVFFFFRVTGRRFLPKKGGCIIASNHLSYLDPIVLSVASPRILSFMAKQELFRNKWFAWLISSLNAFPLARGTADLKSIRFAITKLKEGGTLIIFPEGTRSASGAVHEGHAGVAMLAAKAGVPVIPALIAGTDAALPAGAKKVKLFTPIRVHFGPPMRFDADCSATAGMKENYRKFSVEVIEHIREIKNKNTVIPI